MALPELPRWSEPLAGPDGVMTQQWRDWFEKASPYLQAASEAYGDALPDPSSRPDGAYFTVTPGQDLYQLQAGAWEAL
jgi:hypothetical protein